ncbi:MAG: sodium:proton antiporter [Candidatus Micrarchaeota archaeon]|nr:sodium:proton antiporter [Candidatus Micrarchaeota archaeon]MDE1859612.1 sodium:proton antiporter [Candidatus Micrarchaeota archaeon]
MIDTIETALTLFIMLMLIAQLVALRLRIPYTLILVFIGIVVTAFSTIALNLGHSAGFLLTAVMLIQSLYNQLVVSGLFVGMVVPPLIFEAMMHIKREELRRVIRPSLALATFGVLLSTIVAGIVVWKLAGISLLAALLFATIISPTDTVTVLQVFKHIKVPSRLSTLMDLEAAFNDATAIVLFSIVLTLSSAGLSHETVFNALEIFLYSFVGGVFVGILVGRIALTVHAKINDKLTELTLTIAAVYGSYVLANALGASGLIAVAFVGLYFGNNTLKRAISRHVRASIISFWEIAAFVGTAIAFLFIGFTVNLNIFFQAISLILVAYLSTIIARAVTVYPTFAIFSSRGLKLPLKWGNIATLGGVRGAISIALVATLANSGALYGSELSTITAMVLGVVFISIIIQTPILSTYAGRLFGRYKTTHEMQ